MCVTSENSAGVCTAWAMCLLPINRMECTYARGLPSIWVNSVHENLIINNEINRATSHCVWVNFFVVVVDIVYFVHSSIHPTHTLPIAVNWQSRHSIVSGFAFCVCTKCVHKQINARPSRHSIVRQVMQWSRVLWAHIFGTNLLVRFRIRFNCLSIWMIWYNVLPLIGN